MMRNNIIIFFAILCCMIYSGKTYAQQKISPTVEVKRDFDGKMLEINKSKLDTYVNDSLSNFNLNFNYSIFNKPYRDMYEFTPLPSAMIHSPVTARYPVFMAKVGMGFPLNPNALIYYQPNLTKRSKDGSQPVNNNTLLLKGVYNAFWGDIPLTGINSTTFRTEKRDVKAAADNSVIGAQADYRHMWRGGEFSIGVDYSSNYYTYYGFNELISDNDKDLYQDNKYMRNNSSHTFNNFGINFNIGSVDAKGKGAKFNYNFHVSYKSTTDKVAANNSSIFTNNNKFNENLIKIGGEFGPTFGKYNKFLIGINSETAIYSHYADYHYGIAEVIPQYKFEKGRLLLNIGVKLSAKYSNNSNASKYHNTFAPHVTVSYEIYKNNLWIYGIADGGNNINTYSSLLEKNKWVIPSEYIMASSTPLLIKAGLKGNVFDKFSYEVYGSYVNHKGLLQFINSKNGEHFLTGYSNHNEFSFGGELNWKTKDFTGIAKLKYSTYSKGKKATNIQDGYAPYGYAPLEASLFGEYNWRERIYFGADIYFRSATPFYNMLYIDQNPKVQEFVNLGITVKYVINNNYAVYIQGGNLLNNNVQYHPYYFEKGINFGAGLIVKF